LELLTNPFLCFISHNRVPLVISAIINIAQDVEEDWMLELIDHHGMAKNLTLVPGDMILYESHSIIHGRPYKLNGSYYANLFLQFEPLGYSMDLEQRIQSTNTVRIEGDISKMEFLEKAPTKDLFENALKKFDVIKSNDATTMKYDSKESQHRASQNRRSSKLPSHIAEGTNAASRWRQEFVFYRDEASIAADLELDLYATTSKNKKTDIKTSRGTTGVTSAHILAAKGDMKRLKEIGSKNPNVLNESDSNGWKPIHEAARAGNLEAVEFLLRPEFGVDVNERTNNGDGGSPLWWAEQELPTNHPVIKYLKQRGAVAIAPVGV
jgi:Ankyrin repeats (3 copies)